MVKNLPPPNTRSSKMRNLSVDATDSLGSTVYNMTSSKKLEAVTNLTATRREPTGDLNTNMIYVYFNIPNININEINSVTIRHKPYTQYYTVSFISGEE